MEYLRSLVAAVKPHRLGAGAAEEQQERRTKRCRWQASSRSAVGTGAGLQHAQATGVSLAATTRPVAARMEAHESRPPGKLLTPSGFPVQQPSRSRALLAIDRKSSKQPVVCSNHTGGVLKKQAIARVLAPEGLVRDHGGENPRGDRFGFCRLEQKPAGSGQH
jgi:hypothetical protein